MIQKLRAGPQKQALRNCKSRQQQKDNCKKKTVCKDKVKDKRKQQKGQGKTRKNKGSPGNKKVCHPSTFSRNEKPAKTQHKTKAQKKEKKIRQKKERKTRKAEYQRSEEGEHKYSSLCKNFNKPILRTAKNPCICKQCNEKRKKEKLLDSKENSTSTINLSDECDKIIDKTKGEKTRKTDRDSSEEILESSSSAGSMKIQHNEACSTTDLMNCSPGQAIQIKPDLKVSSECFKNEKGKNVSWKAKKENHQPLKKQSPYASAKASVSKVRPGTTKYMPQLRKKKKSKSLLKFVLKKQKLNELTNQKQCSCCQTCIKKLLQFIKIETERQGNVLMKKLQCRSNKYISRPSAKKNERKTPLLNIKSRKKRRYHKKRKKNKKRRTALMLKTKALLLKRVKSLSQRIKKLNEKKEYCDPLFNQIAATLKMNKNKPFDGKSPKEKQDKIQESKETRNVFEKIAALENKLDEAATNGTEVTPPVSSGMTDMISGTCKCNFKNFKLDCCNANNKSMETIEKFKKLGLPIQAIFPDDSPNSDTEEKTDETNDYTRENNQKRKSLKNNSPFSSIVRAQLNGCNSKKILSDDEACEKYRNRLMEMVNQNLVSTTVNDQQMSDLVDINCTKPRTANAKTRALRGANKRKIMKCKQRSVKTRPRRIEKLNVVPKVTAGIPKLLEQSSKKSDLVANCNKTKKFVNLVFQVGQKYIKGRLQKPGNNFSLTKPGKKKKGKHNGKKRHLKNEVGNNAKQRVSFKTRRTKGHFKSHKTNKRSKSKTLQQKWKLLTDSAIEKLKTAIKRKLMKGVHNKGKKLPHQAQAQAPMPRSGSKLSRCHDVEYENNLDLRAPITPPINSGCNVRDIELADFGTHVSKRTPCPSGKNQSFANMIKKAIEDLEPLGITGKRAIEKYLEIRYNVKNVALISYTLKWMMDRKLICQKCDGQFRYTGKKLDCKPKPRRQFKKCKETFTPCKKKRKKCQKSFSCENFSASTLFIPQNSTSLICMKLPKRKKRKKRKRARPKPAVDNICCTNIPRVKKRKKARKRCPVTAPVKIRYKPRRKKRKPKCCRLKKKSKLMVQKCYKKNGKIYREEEYI